MVAWYLSVLNRDAPARPPASIPSSKKEGKERAVVLVLGVWMDGDKTLWIHRGYANVKRTRARDGV